MLNTTADINAREVVIRQRAIEAISADDNDSNVVVTFRREGPIPIPSITSADLSLATRDKPAGDKALAEQEIELLLNKERRYSESATFHARLAAWATVAEQYGLAMDHTRTALNLSNNPIYALKLAELYVAADQTGQAEKQFASPNLSKNVTAYLRRTELCLRKNEYKPAEELVAAALAIDPSDWRANLLDACLRMAAKQFPDAIRSLRKASKERPNSPQVYTNMGVAHYFSGDFRKACRDLRKAIALDPLNENAIVLLCDISLEHNIDPDIATKYLETYVSYRPTSLPALDRLAKIYCHSGRYEDALNILRAALTIHGDPGTLNNIGVVHAYKGNLPLATKYFAEAGGSAENVYEDHLAQLAIANLITAWFQCSQDDKVIEKALTFIQGCPDERYLADSSLSRIAAVLIRALSRSGRYRELKEIGEAFIDSREISASCLADVASVLSAEAIFAENNAERAVELASKAVEAAAPLGARFRETQMIAMNNLGFALLEADRVDEAAPIVRALSSTVRGRAFVSATKGLLALRNGEYEKGKKLYGHAIAEVQDEGVKNLMQQKLELEKGRYWLGLGDTRKAKKCLQRAVRFKTVFGQGRDIAVFRENAKRLLGSLSE